MPRWCRAGPGRRLPLTEMLFDRTLRRELFNLSGVVFATLFTVMVTTTLIRILGRAAGGGVDTASVLPLIAFSSITSLPTLLSLTLFVSVLMALTRAYRDSEMVIWFATGQSLTAWVRPVLVFATPFVLLVALIAFVAAPWASRQQNEYRQRFEQREDVSRLAPGQFRESASASRVFFVESLSPDRLSVGNVFVTQTEGDEQSIVVASRGGVDVREGQRFLILEQGRRYDGTRNTAELRMMEFERYGIRLTPKPAVRADASARSRPTLALIADPVSVNMAELAWRIGLPLSAVLLALLAIPLSFVNPRVGRSANLIMALLVYVTYSNLLSLSKAWIGQERVPFALGASAVHAALLAIVLLLFARRLMLVNWRAKLMPWRRA
ncbi:MAG: LPS export ABC transporter permease LptF [Burkholderiales bacterium]|nr:MAG: LPS export ABC transporter permease LptF [Burkholderiales bacterium]